MAVRYVWDNKKKKMRPEFQRLPSESIVASINANAEYMKKMNAKQKKKKVNYTKYGPNARNVKYQKRLTKLKAAIVPINLFQEIKPTPPVAAQPEQRDSGKQTLVQRMYERLRK